MWLMLECMRLAQTTPCSQAGARIVGSTGPLLAAAAGEEGADGGRVPEAGGDEEAEPDAVAGQGVGRGEGVARVSAGVPG